MNSLTLYAKLKALPPDLKSEATDFIDFLIQKAKKKHQKSITPKFGSLKGKIKISSDFDKPVRNFAVFSSSSVKVTTGNSTRVSSTFSEALAFEQLYRHIL